jgi:predicted permease
MIITAISVIVFGFAFPAVLAALLRLIFRNIQPYPLALGVGFLYSSALTMNGSMAFIVLPIVEVLEAYDRTGTEINAAIVLLLALQIALTVLVASVGIRIAEKLKSRSQQTTQLYDESSDAPPPPIS